MKTFYTLLLSFLFVCPGLADARPLGNGSFLPQQRTALERAIIKQTRAKEEAKQTLQKEPAAQAQQAIASLVKEKTFFLTLWEDFIELNRQTQENIQKEMEEIQQEIQEELNNNNLSDAAQTHNSTPDYEKLLRGMKAIYIGEVHETESTPLEVINILRAVRRSNPNARILLASEFASRLTWEDPYVKKAGTKDPWMKSYPQIFKAADELKIDQLALDDMIFSHYTEETLATKIGNHIVLTPIKKEQTQEQFMEELNKLHFQLQVSNWGVLTRNEQWADYINQAKPFYDIIIVHAGLGHLGMTPSSDVQKRIDLEPNAVIFINPSDSPSEQICQHYEECYEQYVNPEKLSVEATVDEDLYNQAVQETGIDLRKWKDHSKHFWFYMPEDKDPVTQQVSSSFFILLFLPTIF